MLPLFDPYWDRFWSACEEPAFFHSLSRAGLKVQAVPAKSHERARRDAHVIYIAEREHAPRASP